MEREWAMLAEQDRLRKPLGQALADEFNLSLEEGELLAESEIHANEANDGMITAYWIDVDQIIYGSLREKLRQRKDGPLIWLDVSFFDSVHTSDL